METSSRNSEVIHAGIYYPAGSLKARLCVRGKELLYRYCEQRQVPYRRLGKIIVAVEPGEEGVLCTYEASARANGVTDLQWLGQGDIARLEPAVRAYSGLLSPSTGIIDSHALMLALQQDFEQAGGTLVLKCPVESVHTSGQALQVQLADEERTQVQARLVVNAAGLGAPDLARGITGINRAAIPRAHYAVGHYFTLAAKSPFERLIYPIAEHGGLGVHVTLDLAGNARFGPDVEWRDTVDYRFDASRAQAFARAIRRYYPDLPADGLQPGYTGMRPKISGPGEPAADFLIQDSAAHGVPGLINLLGIESPGLTASLAIAQELMARTVCAD